MNEISWDVPEYYKMEFKGRPDKYCPDCKKKMKYDGWSCEVEAQKLEEWWYCPECKKMWKNPE